MRTRTAPPNLFARIWRDYLRDHWLRMSLALLFMIVEGSALAVMSWMLKPLFDTVFIGGDSSAMWWVGGTIFALFLTRAITSVINRSLLVSVEQAVAAKMQIDLLSHIMRLDMRFFQSNPPGALIERIQGDTRAVQNIWQSFITGAGRDIVALLALFAVAVGIDPVWTLAALIGVPLLILPTVIVQRYVRRKTRTARSGASERATRIDEVLHGIGTIRLNRMEDRQSARFAAIVERVRAAEVKIAATGAVVPAMIDIVTGLGFVGVLALGGAEVTTGERTVGDFMAFFTALSLAFQPLRRLGGLAGAWQIAAASLERVYEIFDTRPTILSGKLDNAPANADIAFDDVRLSFGAANILRGVSFVAKAGQTTALVGPSGAGKTTLFNLLTRMVDPDSGKITLGGADLAKYDLAVLRDQFSVVAQEPALFDETLRENIVLGHEVDESRLTRATDAAYVTEFAASMPLGLSSPSGTRGSALSGGQRQRIAIARAVLRDSPILLLDEATSALDANSERLVQAALDDLSEGRTTLVIAHRLSTIRNADKIVVLDAGRVVEQGNHDQLMASGGTYAALVKMQFGAVT